MESTLAKVLLASNSGKPAYRPPQVTTTTPPSDEQTMELDLASTHDTRNHLQIAGDKRAEEQEMELDYIRRNVKNTRWRIQ